MPTRQDPIALVVLDGWGLAPGGPGNAIALSHPTHLAALQGGAEACRLEASGRAVGLPAGVMGNSEVGHLTIGAGRVIDQDLVRIGEACRSGSIGERPAARLAFEAAKAHGGRLHFIGLCSDAGVHSDVAHLRALVLAASRAGVEHPIVHVLTDGRDTPPDSGPRFVAELEAFLSTVPGAIVGTVGGRYFAMDRDNRWERVEKAYRAIACGEGPRAASASEAVAAAHAAGTTDEFVVPTVIDPAGVVRDGDAVIFFNFRADRARELTRVFAEPGFGELDVPRRALSAFVTMTEYRSDFGLPVIFEPNRAGDALGSAFARAGWPQLRLAETEKYAHVTYFLDGGREAPLPGEERILVPSSKVATYDLEPAMGARAIADHAVAWIRAGGRRLLVVNFANADMVGHTGALDATVTACGVVDEALGRLADAVRAQHGVIAVTADHGNAECMVDARGGPHTAHTTNQVPFIVVDARRPGGGQVPLTAAGGLSDVAPTLLAIAGIDVPPAMTGRDLRRK